MCPTTHSWIPPTGFAASLDLIMNSTAEKTDTRISISPLAWSRLAANCLANGWTKQEPSYSHCLNPKSAKRHKKCKLNSGNVQDKTQQLTHTHTHTSDMYWSENKKRLDKLTADLQRYNPGKQIPILFTYFPDTSNTESTLEKVNAGLELDVMRDADKL